MATRARTPATVALLRRGCVPGREGCRAARVGRRWWSDRVGARIWVGVSSRAGRFLCARSPPVAPTIAAHCGSGSAIAPVAASTTSARGAAAVVGCPCTRSAVGSGGFATTTPPGGWAPDAATMDSSRIAEERCCVVDGAPPCMAAALVRCGGPPGERSGSGVDIAGLGPGACCGRYDDRSPWDETAAASRSSRRVSGGWGAGAASRSSRRVTARADAGRDSGSAGSAVTAATRRRDGACGGVAGSGVGSERFGSGPCSEGWLSSARWEGAAVVSRSSRRVSGSCGAGAAWRSWRRVTVR